LPLENWGGRGGRVMAKYAKIIVDISINQLDQTYDYIIPKGLAKTISIGHAVLIPFGNRKVNGFVVGFSEQTNFEESKIKEIIKIVLPIAFFDDKLLELFQWMASYYKANLIKIIKTAIPTGVLTGQVKKKSIRLVKLNKSVEYIKKYIEEKGKRAYKQVEILNILINSSEREIYTSSELTDLANTSYNTIQRLVDNDLIKYVEQIEDRRPFLLTDKKLEIPHQATDEQKDVIEKVSRQIEENDYGVFLLHGVTGSGKTEVYLQLIDHALNLGLGAIVLVPEISLTPMMVKRFYSRFGDQIAVLHSNLSLGERYDEWRRIKRGEARIVIGARSAVFAPIKNLGLIIIDEEHESTYKQSEYPHYHAREVAIKRSKLIASTVVLGSATPSLESYHFSQKGIYKYLEMPNRVNQKSLPPVEIIDMRQELKDGNATIFSIKLQNSIREALKKGLQVLVFLNRRGYANFILCRECGTVISCNHCDISLTYHSKVNKLRCHYCDYTIKKPLKCPECGSKYLREFGLGTERLEEELTTFFPDAVIDRMDVDTTTRKGSHRKILERVENGQTDILVGTQMIAKGHDYPNIAVVGVISADTILNIPDFRSAERTFQLLTQVAGRTGRGDKNGKVLIQTYSPEHYSIIAAQKHDYKNFYLKEIENREQFLYPPFALLVNIIIQGQGEKSVITGAQELERFLGPYQNLILETFGPSTAPIARIKNKHRWQIILKFNGYKKRNYVLAEINNIFFKNISKNVFYNIDVDPLTVI